mgnify:CR=1 FL=1
MKEDTQFWRDLKANRQKMTKQQYRTIKGCGLPVATSRKARSTDRGDSRDLELRAAAGLEAKKERFLLESLFFILERET